MSEEIKEEEQIDGQLGFKDVSMEVQEEAPHGATSAPEAGEGKPKSVKVKPGKGKGKGIVKGMISTFAVAQELDPGYWTWGSDDPEIFKNEDAGAIGEKVLARLTEAGIDVRDMYIILHDKDVDSGVWDAETGQYVDVSKPDHVHIACRLNGRQTLTDIATAVGVEPQYVEKPKSGRYSYDNSLAYLIHIKYEYKHQYSPDEVITLRGERYADVYAQRKLTWEKGRATVNRQNVKQEDIDWLVDEILKGRITKREILLTDEYQKIYASYTGRVDNAFNVYTQTKIEKTMAAMESGAFRLTCFYIKGKPGAGKTRFANQWFIPLLEGRVKELTGEEWTSYNAADKHGLDDYSGEEIVVIDDLRGSSMDASEWLRLLDPYNINQASCRYHNKAVCPHVIIIACHEDPYKFFYYLKSGGQGEAMSQFIRRLEALVTVIDTDEMGNPSLLTYSPVEKYNEHTPYPRKDEYPTTADADRADPDSARIRGGMTTEYDFSPDTEDARLTAERTAEVMVKQVLGNSGLIDKKEAEEAEKEIREQAKEDSFLEMPEQVELPFN